MSREFIVYDSDTPLVLSGSHLGEVKEINVDGRGIAAPPANEAGELIVTDLPTGLQAGVKTLQILSEIKLQSGESKVVVADEMTFALQPNLGSVNFVPASVQRPSKYLDGSNGTKSEPILTIQVDVTPAIGFQQSATLWLNPLPDEKGSGSAPSAGYGLGSLLRFAPNPNILPDLKTSPPPTKNLQDTFTSNGIALSDDLQVSAIADRTWLLVDGTYHQSYVIREDDTGISVYYGLVADNPKDLNSRVAFQIATSASRVARPGTYVPYVADGTYLARLQAGSDRFIESRLIQDGPGTNYTGPSVKIQRPTSSEP